MLRSQAGSREGDALQLLKEARPIAVASTPECPPELVRGGPPFAADGRFVVVALLLASVLLSRRRLSAHGGPGRAARGPRGGVVPRVARRRGVAPPGALRRAAPLPRGVAGAAARRRWASRRTRWPRGRGTSLLLRGGRARPGSTGGRLRGLLALLRRRRAPARVFAGAFGAAPGRVPFESAHAVACAPRDGIPSAELARTVPDRRRERERRDRRAPGRSRPPAPLHPPARDEERRAAHDRRGTARTRPGITTRFAIPVSSSRLHEHDPGRRLRPLPDDDEPRHLDRRAVRQARELARGADAPLGRRGAEDRPSGGARAESPVVAKSADDLLGGAGRRERRRRAPAARSRRRGRPRPPPRRGCARPRCAGPARALRARPPRRAARARRARAPARRTRSPSDANGRRRGAPRPSRPRPRAGGRGSTCRPDPERGRLAGARRRVRPASAPSSVLSHPLASTSTPAHLDAVPLRVLDERVRRVEPHRLAVQERAGERGGVVAA